MIIIQPPNKLKEEPLLWYLQKGEQRESILSSQKNSLQFQIYQKESINKNYIMSNYYDRTMMTSRNQSFSEGNTFVENMYKNYFKKFWKNQVHNHLQMLHAERPMEINGLTTLSEIKNQTQSLEDSSELSRLLHDSSGVKVQLNEVVQSAMKKEEKKEEFKVKQIKSFIVENGNEKIQQKFGKKAEIHIHEQKPSEKVQEVKLEKKEEENKVKNDVKEKVQLKTQIVLKEELEKVSEFSKDSKEETIEVKNQPQPSEKIEADKEQKEEQKQEAPQKHKVEDPDKIEVKKEGSEQEVDNADRQPEPEIIKIQNSSEEKQQTVVKQENFEKEVEDIDNNVEPSQPNENKNVEKMENQSEDEKEEEVEENMPSYYDKQENPVEDEEEEEEEQETGPSFYDMSKQKEQPAAEVSQLKHEVILIKKKSDARIEKEESITPISSQKVKHEENVVVVKNEKRGEDQSEKVEQDIIDIPTSQKKEQNEIEPESEKQNSYEKQIEEEEKEFAQKEQQQVNKELKIVIQEKKIENDDKGNFESRIDSYVDGFLKFVSEEKECEQCKESRKKQKELEMINEELRNNLNLCFTEIEKLQKQNKEQKQNLSKIEEINEDQTSKIKEMLENLDKLKKAKFEKDVQMQKMEKKVKQLEEKDKDYFSGRKSGKNVVKRQLSQDQINPIDLTLNKNNLTVPEKAIKYEDYESEKNSSDEEEKSQKNSSEEQYIDLDLKTQKKVEPESKAEESD